MKNYIIFFIILIIFTYCRKNSFEKFTTNLNKNKNLLDVNKIVGKNPDFLKINNMINDLIKNLSIESFLVNSDEETKSKIFNGVKLFFTAYFGVLNRIINSNKCSNNLSTKNLGCYNIKSCNNDTKNCSICKKFDLEKTIIDLFGMKEKYLFSFYNLGLNQNEIDLFKRFYINPTDTVTRNNIIENGKIVIYQFGNFKKFSLNCHNYFSQIMIKGKGTYLVKGLIFVLRLIVELKWNIWEEEKYLPVFIAILCLPALRWKELSKKKFNNDTKRYEAKIDLINQFKNKLNLSDNYVYTDENNKEYTENELFDAVADHLLRQDFFGFTVLYIDEKMFNPITLYLLTKQIYRNDENYSFFKGEKLDKIINLMQPNKKISILEMLLSSLISRLNKLFYNNKLNEDNFIENADIRDIEVALTDIVSQESSNFSKFAGQMSFIGYGNNFKPHDSEYNVVTDVITKDNIQNLKFFKIVSVVQFLYKNVFSNSNLKNYDGIDYSKSSIVEIYNELVYASLGNKSSISNFRKILFRSLAYKDDLLGYYPHLFNTNNSSDSSDSSNAKKAAVPSVPWLKIANDIKNYDENDNTKCLRWNNDRLEKTEDENLCSENNYYPHYLAKDRQTCLGLKDNNIDPNSIECESETKKHYPTNACIIC